MRRFISGLLLSAVLAAVPCGATAGVPRGTLRPSLDTVFLQYVNGALDPERGNDVDYSNFGIGLGLPYVGIGFGAAVIDNLLIGGRVTLGYQTTEIENADESAFAWGILPYVEYMFLDGVVRPFVMGTLGFEGETGEIGNNDFNEWRFAFGGGGGAHFFIVPAFSIDATMILWGRVGNRETEQGQFDVDYTLGEFRLDTLIGLSGWF